MPVQITVDLDVDYLISIAEKAGQAIMEIYDGDAANWEVDHKADDSPLTRADKEANRIICDALMEWTPHIPIISEENKVAPFATRQVRHLLHALRYVRALQLIILGADSAAFWLQKYQYCWVVDPLDGTKEFIKRVPHFTVNIALIKGTAPLMGVVCTPAAATMHFAVKGQGAFVRCAFQPIVSLVALLVPSLRQHCVLLCVLQSKGALSRHGVLLCVLTKHLGYCRVCYNKDAVCECRSIASIKQGGQPGRCRTLTTDDKQIRCKEYIPEAEGLSIVASASHLNALTKDFMAMHKNPSPVQVGSSLKFLLVRSKPSLQSALAAGVCICTSPHG